MKQDSIQIYMPNPANTHFYGTEVSVSFNAHGVSTVKDNNGNESLNQSAPDQVTLEIQDHQGTTTYQTLTIKVDR